MDRQLAPNAITPANPFGRGKIPGTERVLCLDEETGEILWTHDYECIYTMSFPAGPRTTPIIDAGKVYTLGAEGDLRCLNAKTGDLIIAKLSPDGYQEIDRAHLLEPTNIAGTLPRKVVWSHPAFAYKRIYARNGKEIVCAELAAAAYKDE